MTLPAGNIAKASNILMRGANCSSALLLDVEYVSKYLRKDHKSNILKCIDYTPFEINQYVIRDVAKSIYELE